MRNLKLLNHFGNTFPEIHGAELISQLYENNHELVIVHNLKVSKINTRNGSSDLLFDIREVTEIESPDVFVIDLAYFTIENLLICALSNGIIIRYDMESKTTIDAQQVFSNGIKVMKISPDNELLVFAMCDSSIYLTDCRLDTIMVSSLLDEKFGEGEFINVGWGKKETQFHGSEGKQAAKNVQVVETYDGKTDSAAVTWRGDSALFAVGYYHNLSYIFKVFDREGVLQYTSETQSGLECNFAWRPSGNLIATSQQLPNKYVIAFFEKNGLKHGEFTLPFKNSQVEIKKINWSLDSEILSIWYTDVTSNKSCVIFYTVNNYHWYLKYSICLEDEIASLVWDETTSAESGKFLHILLANGKYLSYSWVWNVNRSKGKTSQDRAVVGVIDGSRVLVTSFKETVIPPPMAGWTLENNTRVNHIAFAPSYDKTVHFVLLQSNKILRYFNLVDNISFSWEMSLEDHLSESGNCRGEITQLLWVTSNIIVGIYRYSEKSKIIIIDVESSSLKSVNILDIHEELICLSSNEFGEEVIIQTSTGKLIKYSLSDNSITALPHHFPEPCYEMDVFCENNNTFVFGLALRNRFYINNQEVANSVNSFFVHSDFLLLTTLRHQILCCPLSSDIVNTLSVGAGTESEKNNLVSSRKVERGSKLVTAVSCDCRVVLQLPRGNLEAIQPRALSLKMIGHFLDNCKYYEAFDMMRKQRINLNLMYDHNPQLFVKNIKSYISQINNISWLNLFISDLEDHDVARVMYSTSYSHKKDNECNGGKIKMVCQLMRNALVELNDKNNYILPLITTYVKTNDIQDIEKALLLIKDINSTLNESLVSADDAIRYLLYMIHVDKLYDVALGLYDFDLVMFVAGKSQKDPKEYVPFLNKLKEMEVCYRRYTIDDFLKKYESALKNLVECGMEMESELIVYIKRHNLYKAALKYIESNDPRYKGVAEIYGNYLMSHRNYKEAGVMFKRCNNLEKALEAFVEDADWRSAMFIAEALGMEEDSITKMQDKLLTELKERKQYDNALELLQYNNTSSITELINCCLEGHLYRKVIGICAKFKCLEQMDTAVLPIAMEHYSSLLSMIIQNEDAFIKQKSRLFVVRTTKKEREELGEEMIDDCDLYSDTSSVMSNVSRSTNRTFRSSKNRRKHERKLMSLKEGSKFEDLALIRSLHTLITNTFELQKNVNELSFLLQWLNKDQEMLNLQNSLEKVLLQMSNSTSEIWTADLWSETLNSKPEIEITSVKDELASAVSSLEPYLKIPPVVQKINWKLQPLCL